MEWKQKKFSSFDELGKREAEAAFKALFNENEVKKMIVPKEKFSILSVKPKTGSKLDRSRYEGKTSFFGIEYEGIPTIITCGTEKKTGLASLSNIWSIISTGGTTEELLKSDFKGSRDVDVDDIECYKLFPVVWTHEGALKMLGTMGITMLWAKEVSSHDQRYFIVAINEKENVSQRLKDKMEIREVLEALTGVKEISRDIADIASRTMRIDYTQQGGQEPTQAAKDLPFCKDALYCKDTSKEHMSRFKHVCGYGEKCPNLKDKTHCTLYYHIKTTCRNGYACTIDDAEHRMMYHGETKEWCPKNPCDEFTNPEHRKTHMHGPRPIKLVSFDGFNTERGTAPDFDGNMERWMEKTQRFLGVGDIRSANSDFERISKWMGSLQAVHQCSGKALESIANVGAIASLNKLRGMWQQPTEMTKVVWLRKDGEEFMKSVSKEGNEEKHKTAKKYVKKYCRYLQATKSPKIVFI